MVKCLTNDRDGRIKLALVVEERHVLHLGEGLVGIGVVGGALDSRPVADPRVHPDDRVLEEAVLADVGLGEDDRVRDPRPGADHDVLADRHVRAELRK